MKHINHLFSLFLAITLSVSAWGNEVTVPDPESGTAITTTTYLPIAINIPTRALSAGCYSVSQQLYYASELNDNSTKPSSTTINAITFYYNSGTNMTRKLRVWMNSTSMTDFPASTDTPNFVAPGTKVFSGDVNLQEPNPYTITFDTPYAWDGTSNIIITVFDSTGLFNSNADQGKTPYTPATQMFEDVGKVRFLHKLSTDKNFDNAGWTMDNLTASTAYSLTPDKRKYANKITFTFAAAPVPPATPSDLAASNVGSTSASLSWSAVEGATSYKLYHSTSAEGIYSELASPTTNSFDWSGLTASTTYFVKVAAVNGVGSSALSESISFTTLASHIHDGITFEPWSNPSAMPNSGNYYLANDVTYDFYEGGYVDLAGDLNLCLNGHTINLGTKSINVTADHTMTIYDPVGGGKITGFVPGQDGAYTYKGVISVENNGTLVLREGEVENTYPDDNPEYKSIAIAVGGTLILSGAPVISSNEMDIYLPPTIPAKVITIQSGKPLTNSTPYKVYKMDGVITSGWANMSGEDPRDYFVSANPERVVCLNGSGEAELVGALALNENSSSNEDRIAAQRNQLVNVNLTRSTLTNASFNSICLPFGLNNAQLEEIFGAGYDLEEFVSSEIDGDELVLTFNKVTSLVARKPYLLQPANSVTNPEFAGVTIADDEHPLHEESDTYISFHGVFNPTELTGGNKNLLFLGADNTLYWPEATGNIKGFRAYFEVKAGAARSAARVLMSTGNRSPQGIQSVQDSAVSVQKVIRDGKLIIIRDGKEYNAQGILIR